MCVSQDRCPGTEACGRASPWLAPRRPSAPPSLRECAKFHRTQGWLALKSRSQKLKTHQLAGYRQPINKLTVTEHIPGFITGAAGLATSAKAAGRLVSLDARKRRAHAR